MWPCVRTGLSTAHISHTESAGVTKIHRNVRMGRLKTARLIYYHGFSRLYKASHTPWRAKTACSVVFASPEMRTGLVETISLSTVLPLIARIVSQGSRDQAAERSSGQKHPDEAGIKASQVLFQATNLGVSTHIFLAGVAAVKTVEQHQHEEKKTPSLKRSPLECFKCLNASG